jgi:hypothetical protein
MVRFHNLFCCGDHDVHKTVTRFIELFPSRFIAGANLRRALSRSPLGNPNETYKGCLGIVMRQIVNFFLSNEIKNIHNGYQACGWPARNLSWSKPETPAARSSSGGALNSAPIVLFYVQTCLRAKISPTTT